MTKHTPHNQRFYTLGKYLSKPLVWLLHQEQPLIHWLITKGLPAKIASGIILTVNLLLLVSLLLLMIPVKFIIFIVLIIFLAYVGIDARTLFSTEQNEHQMHTLGEDDDPRNEPGYDPVLYNDRTHEQYPQELDE